MSKRKKCYAVSVGHTPGVYDTWEECKAQVDGFSGAKYKGFATQAQALQFLENSAATPQPRVGAGGPKRKREEEEDTAEDGSGAGGERRTGQPARQTKLITSPFFSSTSTSSSSSSSSSDADPRGRKRPRTLPSSASSSTRSTTLQKFFEDNNLQVRKWVDKDWIVANWK